MTFSNLQPLIQDRSLAVLNSNPPVLATFELDFEKNLPALTQFARENPRTTFLLQLGYERETTPLAKHLATMVHDFLDKIKGSRIITFCNSKNELQVLANLGMEVRLIQQNCFLDERRYCPLPYPKRYDAAYLARLTPCKRHELIPTYLGDKLLLMGTFVFYEQERDYAEMVKKQYASAVWVSSFRGNKISELLSQAKCGLMLSAREGASFCSSEYFLCGLPVIDTPALGGRETLYPEEFVKYVNPTQTAVGAGIEYWASHLPDPEKVRQAWLEKVKPYRMDFQALMRELTGKTYGRPPHKLGLRTPHPGEYYSKLIQLYLGLKRLFH